MTIDDNRKIQWVNGAVDHILGYSHAELLGQQIDILLQPAVPCRRRLRRPRSQQGRESDIGSRPRQEWKVGYFDVSLGHRRADQRNFVTTIWRDVTERVAADAALRDARDALQKSNEELESRVEERTREREIALKRLHESQKMESIGQFTAA